MLTIFQNRFLFSIFYEVVYPVDHFFQIFQIFKNISWHYL